MFPAIYDTYIAGNMREISSIPSNTNILQLLKLHRPNKQDYIQSDVI